MPAPLLSKDEVIGRLLVVFEKFGYEAASLSLLSQETGLGKSSLYHYFPGGKKDMALAVIELVNDWLDKNAIGPLKAKGTPQKRLKEMLQALGGLYEDGKKSCVLGNLALGNSRSLFKEPLKQAFANWIKALEELTLEAGVCKPEAKNRAETAIVIIEGALVLARGLNDYSVYERAVEQIPDLLLRK